MKTVTSWVLFLAGMVAAITLSCRVVDGVDATARLSAWAGATGISFVTSLTAMVVGALGLRRAQSSAAGGNKETVASSGEVVVVVLGERLTRVREQLARIDAGGKMQLMDDLQEVELPKILELRQQMVQQMGLLHYAAFMSPFASFERNLARAWSANVDGVVGEVEASLERARVALDEAIGQLDEGQG